MWQHENYDSSIIVNDVSILKLAEPLVFSDTVKALPLAAVGKVTYFMSENLLFS